MHVQLDPDTPIYILVNKDGEAEIFQFPYRVTHLDSNGKEVATTFNDIEELIRFWDENGLHDLRGTLVEIDAHMGTAQRILPRY